MLFPFSDDPSVSFGDPSQTQVHAAEMPRHDPAAVAGCSTLAVPTWRRRPADRHHWAHRAMGIALLLILAQNVSRAQETAAPATTPTQETVAVSTGSADPVTGGAATPETGTPAAAPSPVEASPAAGTGNEQPASPPSAASESAATTPPAVTSGESTPAGTTETAGVSAEAAAPAPTPTLDTGDQAWILASSALVLFMTAPGLAMFYGGLVRKKNILSVIMQCVFLMGLMTVLWAIYGYSLSFGDGNAWIGDARYLFLKGTMPEWDEAGKAVGAAPVFPLTRISRLLHMVYQGMFFIITPALICGAFAERMKFSAMVVFSILWGTLIYCPLCHWVWGGGILAYGSPHSVAYGGGALDFAGGAVVHISSGLSALVCALVLGRRLGFGSQPMPPHNLTYTALGAAMLWVGWFGFNGGSALGAGDLATIAFVNTHFAAASGTLTWAGLEWLLRGKPSVLGACSGAVAGLVVITPASGFVVPMHALIMGVAAGCVCFWACTSLKNSFKYDDALDAFGVHGVGGTLGALLTGVFATRAVNNVGAGKPLGLIEGGSIMTGQLIATGITIVFAVVVTYVLLKLIDAVIGLRASQAEETRGLDLSDHGEEGYIFL